MELTRIAKALSVVLVFVLAVSHVGPVLIALHSFQAGLTVALALVVTVMAAVGLRHITSRKSAVTDYRLPETCAGDLLLVLAVALVFRFMPLPYFAGGRDDGVYTAMAAHLTRSPSVVHRDPTLASYPPEGRKFYDSVRTTPLQNVDENPSPAVAGRFEGCYLPGVYFADADAMTCVFQFIHVHPIWMAIVGSAFGLDQMNWAVIAFGLLSVVVFYLLVHGLTDSRRWAVVGSLLLAVNPLHAFFSRCSVSEPTALFFLLACLLMMVWAWRLAADTAQRWLWGLLAAGCFSAYCLTRLDGFFFLPFLAVATAYLVSLTDRRDIRLVLVGSFAVAVGAFVASVVYLHATSYPYAHEQYDKIFGPLLGTGWRVRMPLLIASVVLLYVALLVVVWRRGRGGRLFARLRVWLAPALSLLMILALAWHVVKVVKLATAGEADQIGYVERFGLAGLGWQSAGHSSLLNAAIYLSPPIILLFLWELARWRERDHRRTLVLLLVSGYFIYAAVFQWVLPYQFYYGRYLLSGVLPFMLLLVIQEMARRRSRTRLGALLIGGGLVWSVAAAAPQLRFSGYHDLVEGLAATVQDVDRADLVLLDTATCDADAYQLPLIYEFDRNVWTFFGRQELLNLLARPDLLDGFADVFMVSRLNYAPGRFVAVDDVAFSWASASRRPILPRDQQTRQVAYTLFRYDRTRADGGGEHVFYQRGKGSVWEHSGFYPDLAWTTGRLELHFDLGSTDHAWLDIRLRGWRPSSRDAAISGAGVRLNGVALAPVDASRLGLNAQVPEGVLQLRDNLLVIEVETFVPATRDSDLRDGRALGLDIDTISFR